MNPYHQQAIIKIHRILMIINIIYTNKDLLSKELVLKTYKHRELVGHTVALASMNYLNWHFKISG